MLRPQVFALQQGEVPIGLSASEKQAIDATLSSLASEDSRFWACADHYWSARGGSHTDGGSFSFTVSPGQDGKMELICTNKFGKPIYPEGKKLILLLLLHLINSSPISLLLICFNGLKQN